MNGKEKLQRQIRSGTRPIVEAIDNLRLRYGFENVKSLTPIVETKLRNGNVPQRPLQLAFCPFDGQDLSFIITIPIRFPEEPYHLGLQPGVSIPIDLAAELSLIEDRINNIALKNQELVEEGVKLAKQFLATAENEWILNLTNGNGDNLLIEAEDDEDIVDVFENDNEDQLPECIEEQSAEYFCCRICSTKLFDSEQISHSSHAKVKCSSMYLHEAPEFVKLGSDNQEGKIYCPKCAARVGSWSWVGSRCSCKEWIVPSFQFVSSKLDGKKV